MTNFRCDICHDSFALNKFRFLHCGHGFCEICLRKTRKQKICAICRQPKGSDEPRQIYITSAEQEPTNVDEKANRIVAGLNKIGVNSPAISLERAGRKLRDIIEYIDPATADELLEAIKNLEERVLPLYSELEFEQAEKVVLQRQVENLKQKLKQTESSSKEIERLQAQLSTVKKNYEAEVSLCLETRSLAIREMDENMNLNRLAQRQQRGLEKKDEEIKQLQSSIEDREKEIGLLMRKLRALSKLGKRPKLRAQDPDESLQVEPSEVIRTQNQGVDESGSPVKKKRKSSD